MIYDKPYCKKVTNSGEGRFCTVKKVPFRSAFSSKLAVLREQVVWTLVKSPEVCCGSKLVHYGECIWKR